jgi:putative hydrolase of the HAD superfamily
VSEEVLAALRALRAATDLEYSVLGVLRLVAERLGITFDLPDRDLAYVLFEGAVTMAPTPHVGELLDAADRAGCPVAILSNTAFPAEVLERCLAQRGLAGRFRFVMASADYGLRKPHATLFATAAARLRLDPADIWFAGDRPSRDVAGANRAGMVSVHYDIGVESPDAADHEQRADITVRDWRELAALLPQAQ